MGSAETYRPFVCDFANTTRMSCLVPNYGLTPENKFPTQILDAIRSIEKCVELYNPKNLFLAGKLHFLVIV